MINFRLTGDMITTFFSYSDFNQLVCQAKLNCTLKAINTEYF